MPDVAAADFPGNSLQAERRDKMCEELLPHAVEQARIELLDDCARTTPVAQVYADWFLDGDGTGTPAQFVAHLERIDSPHWSRRVDHILHQLLTEGE